MWMCGTANWVSNVKGDEAEARSGMRCGYSSWRAVCLIASGGVLVLLAHNEAVEEWPLLVVGYIWAMYGAFLLGQHSASGDN